MSKCYEHGEDAEYRILGSGGEGFCSRCIAEFAEGDPYRDGFLPTTVELVDIATGERTTVGAVAKAHRDAFLLEEALSDVVCVAAKAAHQELVAKGFSITEVGVMNAVGDAFTQAIRSLVQARTGTYIPSELGLLTDTDAESLEYWEEL